MTFVAIELLDRAQEALGGGTLSVWLIAAGLLALFLAYKAVKFAMKLVALATAAVLFLGTAPWAGEPVTGATAECAGAAVEQAASGWQTNLTKRITVEALSPDAACADSGVGLASGSAEAKLRSFWDVPFQTWDITPDTVEPRVDLPGS